MIDSRCTVCRSILDAEDLFCSNCGTENPDGVDTTGMSQEEVQSVQQTASVMSFRCEQCGSSMSYDASAKQLRCPFCGSERLTERLTARTLKPIGVVPFQIERSQVEKLVREWLARGFWRPNDAAAVSVISTITQVFVPYWVFSVQTESAWTADTSRVPIGSRGNWRPISGNANRSYNGLLVAASGTLNYAETKEIEPFYLTALKSPDEIDLENVIVEEFRVTRRDARIHARGVIDQVVSEEVRKQLDGSIRNLKVNVRYQDMTSRPILLPVWIMVYHYKEKPFRVLINGQTGEVVGLAPFSNSKLVFVAASVFALVLIIIAFVIIASLASR